MTPNDRQSMGWDDFTAFDLPAIRQAEPPPEAAACDREMTEAARIERHPRH